MTGAAALGVVVLTYNRPQLVRLLVESLAQQSDPDFQLVLYDNGSDRGALRHIEPLLSDFARRPVVFRKETNAFSAYRVQEAVALSGSEFAVLPGDDDIALPDYVARLKDLTQGGSSVTVAAAAARVVDAKGKATGDFLRPAQFASRVEALASLLCGNAYCFPSTAFRSGLIVNQPIPKTMTSLDWWIWLRGWSQGEATTTHDPILDYRVHEGQQQRWYGRSLFSLDGARMILFALSDPVFLSCLDELRRDEVESLAKLVMSDPGGLNIGQGDYSPLLQVALADRLAGRLSHDSIEALYAQAAVCLGVVPPQSSLRALSGRDEPSALSEFAWSRIGVEVSAKEHCPHVDSWSKYLGLVPRSTSDAIASVVYQCNCAHSRKWELTVSLRSSLYPASDFSCRLNDDPSDGTSSEVRFLLGESARTLRTGVSLPATVRQLELLRARWIRNPLTQWAIRAVRRRQT